jgi:hypothetical protein
MMIMMMMDDDVDEHRRQVIEDMMFFGFILWYEKWMTLKEIRERNSYRLPRGIKFRVGVNIIIKSILDSRLFNPS